MKEIYKLDLEWQYTMLAHHVKEFLTEASNFEEDGIYPVVDDDLEPMRKRLEVIKRIMEKAEQVGCQDFAQPELVQDYELILNRWPESQICMDCEHSVFILNEPSSTYACERGVQLGSCASSCPRFEEKEEEEIL